MDYHTPPLISSFVIRFVVDSTSNTKASTSYHGFIRHIQSDEELSFSSWDAAVTFMRQYVPLETDLDQNQT